MSPGAKQTGILGGILCVLVVMYFSGLLFSRPPQAPTIVPSFTASAVRAVQTGSVELRPAAHGAWEVRIEGDWYPADGARINKMLDFLSGLKASRTASRSKADWGSFQVDSASAAHLSVTGLKGNLVDLYVGETGADGGTFVRRAGAQEVYEVFGSLADYADSSAGYWSYLKILPSSLSVDSLQTISISTHGFSVGGNTVNASYLLASSVENGTGRWVAQGKGGASLDQQKVLSLEAEILQMVGDSFAAGVSLGDAGLESPTARIGVSDQQGDTWSILVGKRYGAQFYVKRADKPYIYLVNEWTLHRAIPALGELEVNGGPAVQK